MRKLLNILLLLSFGIASAHKDVIFQKTYGNVNLISVTPFYTEEVNQNIITAKYVELLLKELNYKESIDLWLRPDSDSKFRAYFGNDENQQKSLNIFIPSKERDIAKTLNLVENVILNLKSIDKAKDKLINWYNLKNSKLVEIILLNKIFRPKDVPELISTEFFDYYFENGIYHILSYQNYEVIEVLQLSKILQFSVPVPNLLFMFTEMDSLTIIKAEYKYNGTNYNATSDNVTFKFEPEWKYSFRPYKIRLLGQKYVTIESITGEKVSLYNIPKKKLTQDLLAKFED
jgi:hypothetical protein